MKSVKHSDFYEVKVHISDPETLGCFKDTWDTGIFPSLTRMYDAALCIGLDMMAARRAGRESVYEDDARSRDTETLYRILLKEYREMREESERTKLLVNSVVNASRGGVPEGDMARLYERGCLSSEPGKGGAGDADAG